MAHKAFEVIGKKALLCRHMDNFELEIMRECIKSGRVKSNEIKKILETGIEKMLGIFLKSEPIRTTISSDRGELDFIEPIYTTTEIAEALAEIKNRGIINQKNPILRIHLGINPEILRYSGEMDRIPTFEVNGIDLYNHHAEDCFVSDGDYETFNKYVQPLRNTGFEAYEIIPPRIIVPKQRLWLS